MELYVQEEKPAVATSYHLLSPLSPETHMQQKNCYIGMSCLKGRPLQMGERKDSPLSIRLKNPLSPSICLKVLSPLYQ